MTSTTESRRSYEQTRLGKYKPGSIRRIKLENFLTYSAVEFCPGPRLNMVIGPNGTGKSSILCAICLGLGGSPQNLGRADDARLFIMHEKETAMIEIELSPQVDKVVHVLRRVIDRNKGTEKGRGRGASTFFINDQKVSEKEVKALVATYNIAVDNLCTFLPQDRVGSFSGFDKHQLLQETEKSMSGSQHLYKQHLALIDAEKEIFSSGNSEKTIQERLKTLEAEQQRLEREKERMEERQKAVEQATLLEQKKAWLEFDSCRQNALDLKERQTQVKSEFQAAQRKIQPLVEKHARLLAESENMRQKHSTVEASMQRTKKEIDKHLRKYTKFEEEIDSNIQSINSIDALKRKAQRDADQQAKKVQDLEAQIADYPPTEEVEKQKAEAVRELNRLRSQLSSARSETDQLDQRMAEKQRESKHAESKLLRMRDEKARRRDRIFDQNPSLKDTYAWVEANRNRFRHKIWGPVVVEITTKSASAASYLEQHVSNTVFKSYVVECKEDYDLLFREVRQNLGKPINIQIVSNGVLQPITRMYSEQKMKVLKEEHGVLGYLDEMFTAPDAILQALRTSSNVQSVLVGSEKTQESLDRRGLLEFLSKKENGDSGLMASCIFSTQREGASKYTQSVSRYSGKTTLRVDGVGPARMLAPGTNPAQKAKLEETVQKLNAEVEKLRPLLQEAQKRANEIEKEGQAVNLRLKEAKAAITDIRNAGQRLERAKRVLEDYQKQASQDNEAEARSMRKKLKNNAANAISALELANKSHSELIKLAAALAAVKMGEEGIVASVRRAKELLEEKQSLTATLEHQLVEVDRAFKEAKRLTRQLKERANSIAPIQDGQGNELPLKQQLEELPNTLEDVEAAFEEAMQKANSIADNPEVIRQYEERKREIEEITDEMEGLTRAQDEKREKLKQIKDPWEAALINTVQKVDVLFQTYMSELGCAGEVRLYKGEGNAQVGNFKDWGIEILVKFRESSKLQVLSAQVHSGGERSVSTIMYLMALQNMMVSPFRCVDEINQGLDERNERLVFKRIVENSTEQPRRKDDPLSHSGQYFLITPKLLPNLTDMENEELTVLCIYNGHHNFQNYSDWNVTKFIEMRKEPGGEEPEEMGQDEDDKEEVTIPRRNGRRRTAVKAEEEAEETGQDGVDGEEVAVPRGKRRRRIALKDEEDE